MKSKIILIFTLFSFGSFADFKEMSERLIKTRREIEILNNDLEVLQKRQTSQFETLLSRRSELEITLKKERLKSIQLKEKKIALSLKISPKKGLSPQEKSFLSSWKVELERWVKNSLPIKMENRLADLNKIEEEIKMGDAFHNILDHLWKFAEKEMSLVGHNKFEITDLDVNHKKIKAEIARLGLVSLAFKTPNQEYGFAKRNNGQWIFEIAKNSDEETAAKRLISKFKDKKYSGLYDVPIKEL